LVEGHNGIFEVIINNEVVFTNQGQCRNIPAEGAVLQKLLDYAELLPGKKIPITGLFPMA
jgi:hypothetical protein